MSTTTRRRHRAWVSDRWASHAFGVVAGMAFAVSTRLTVDQAVIVTTIASTCAGGPLSPDIDLYKMWRRIAKTVNDLLPGTTFSHRGMLKHRGITHWPGSSLTVATAVLWTQSGSIPPVLLLLFVSLALSMQPADVRLIQAVVYVLWAVALVWLSTLDGAGLSIYDLTCAVTIAGWGSHLVWDVLFGRRDPRRPYGSGSRDGHGIPMSPWWNFLGVGLRSSGLTEMIVTCTALPIVAAWLGYRLTR